MRGATNLSAQLMWLVPISIHAPHAGGDAGDVDSLRAFIQFQSTPPMRGATLTFARNGHILSISIHAPHAGGDVPNI